MDQLTVKNTFIELKDDDHKLPPGLTRQRSAPELSSSSSVMNSSANSSRDCSLSRQGSRTELQRPNFAAPQFIAAPWPDPQDDEVLGRGRGRGKSSKAQRSHKAEGGGGHPSGGRGRGSSDEAGRDSSSQSRPEDGRDDREYRCRRPSKRKRATYSRFCETWELKIREDPDSFDPDNFSIPAVLAVNSLIRGKIVERLTMYQACVRAGTVPVKPDGDSDGDVGYEAATTAALEQAATTAALEQVGYRIVKMSL